MASSLPNDPARCANCGASGNPLAPSPDGSLWCMETAMCDLTEYHRHLSREIEQSEHQAAIERA